MEELLKLPMHFTPHFWRLAVLHARLRTFLLASVVIRPQLRIDRPGLAATVRAERAVLYGNS